MQKDEVRIADLERVFAALIETMKGQFGADGAIPLEADYYWEFDPDELYNSHKDPQQKPTLGQLTDDWATLRKAVATGNIDPYACMELGNVLRYIGAKGLGW